ncbi:hypothetical protein OS493_035030, partial [Desmophyllum pertusum]
CFCVWDVEDRGVCEAWGSGKGDSAGEGDGPRAGNHVCSWGETVARGWLGNERRATARQGTADGATATGQRNDNRQTTSRPRSTTHTTEPPPVHHRRGRPSPVTRVSTFRPLRAQHQPARPRCGHVLRLGPYHLGGPL